MMPRRTTLAASKNSGVLIYDWLKAMVLAKKFSIRRNNGSTSYGHGTMSALNDTQALGSLLLTVEFLQSYLASSCSSITSSFEKLAPVSMGSPPVRRRLYQWFHRHLYRRRDFQSASFRGDLPFYRLKSNTKWVLLMNQQRFLFVICMNTEIMPS